jgi:Putative addiction module component
MVHRIQAFMLGGERSGSWKVRRRKHHQRGLHPGPVSELWEATPFELSSPSEAHMSTTLEALQAEVLSLSPKDRARLLDRLIASLDADTEVEAAWDAVAAAREAEMITGTVQSVPLDDALSRLEARFPG